MSEDPHPPGRTVGAAGGRRRAPWATGPTSATVRRPDGRLQTGVWPGALVASGPTRDPAVHQLLGAVQVGDPGRTEQVPRCPVLGQGPVATRLAATLGQVSPADPATRLVVLVHQHVIPPEVGVAVARDGRLHLPVVVQPRRVVIGPLSGRPEDPCLHCLDLSRRDRDPGWPELASWLGRPEQQRQRLPVAAEVLAATEGVVLLLARSVLAGRPLTSGLAHEVGSQAPHVVVRTWLRHPGCTWHPGDPGSG